MLGHVMSAESCDISPPLHVQLAEEHGVKFMETSAKSGLNVETVSREASGCLNRCLWCRDKHIVPRFLILMRKICTMC